MLRLRDWRSDLGASHSLEYLTGEIAKNMLLCLHTFTFTMTGSCLPTQQTPLFQIRRGWPFASNCLEAVCLLNCGKMRQLLHLHTFPFTMTGDCLTNFLRIEKEWQLLCDQSRKTNQIFEERRNKLEMHYDQFIVCHSLISIDNCKCFEIVSKISERLPGLFLDRGASVICGSVCGMYCTKKIPQ